MTNPVVELTARFAVPVCPCVTPIVPPDRFEVTEKVSVVAVTCRLTVVDCVAAPDAVPVTVTVDVAAAAFGCVLMVRVLVQLLLDETAAGLKLHDVSCGAPVHPRVTVPLNPFSGVMVTVVVVELPAATLVGLKEPAATLKLTTVAAQATARLLASTDPRPVTRL